MHKFSAAFGWGPALLAISGTVCPTAQAVIFGKDDRQDYDDVSPALAELAQSTVAFFHQRKFERSGDGKTFRLATENYGARANLCPGERFAEQPSGSDFSGALVGVDRVLTAGHALRNTVDCENFRAVFGFFRRAGKVNFEIPTSEVYACAEIIAFAKGPAGDYTVIRLDRPVERHAPLKVARQRSPLAEGTPLIVMGHPNGLALKVAGGAQVRAGGSESFLRADTDTFVGNSGSPVFHARTRKIIGILVNGSEPDTVPDASAGCRRIHRVPAGEGQNEILTRASTVTPWIPRQR